MSRLQPTELGSVFQSFHQLAARHAVLDSVNLSLVLFENCLINTANGEYRDLTVGEDHWAGAVAAAARQLAGLSGTETSVVLLLPPSMFVATHFSLKIQGEQLLRSSLQLQVHSLIAACDGELLLGINGASSEGAALWMPRRKADELFEAFRNQGLFLAACMPRSLALMPDGTSCTVLDEDAGHLSQLVSQDGVLSSVLSLARQDLQQPDFQQQWEQETSRKSKGDLVHARGRDDWSGIRRTIKPGSAYVFLPPASLAKGRSIIAKKQKKLGMALAAALLIAALLPFVANQIRTVMLENELAEVRMRAAGALASQAAVFGMEDEWGTIADYPQQDVAQVLLTLNSLIENSLSTFSLNKGVVDITGFAQDPALLLDQLSQQVMFFDVSQSRSSSGSNSFDRGDRFGIRMNLTGVDYEAYEDAHPESID